MRFGEGLRQMAERAKDKQAHGESGMWTLVLSAPGFMGRTINEYWLSAKNRGTRTPTPEDWAQLRTIIADAGGPSGQDPEHPVIGMNLWRWAPSVDAPLAAVESSDDAPTPQVLVDPDVPPDIIENNKVGRNDPCPCGSGKKYKKCCLGNSRPIVGVCLAAVEGGMRCGRQGVSSFFCKACGKQYPWCGDELHKKDAQTMMNGHIVRVHPEMIPTRTFDGWIKDPLWMAFHEEQRAKQPELWARLFEYINERRNIAGPN